MDRLRADIEALHEARRIAMQKVFSLGFDWVDEKRFEDFKIARNEWATLEDANGRVCRMIDITPNGGIDKWIYCDIDSHFEVDVHRHPDYEEILFIVSGAGVVSVNAESSSVKANSIISIEPGVPHSGKYTERTVLLMILRPIL